MPIGKNADRHANGLTESTNNTKGSRAKLSIRYAKAGLLFVTWNLSTIRELVKVNFEISLILRFAEQLAGTMC